MKISSIIERLRFWGWKGAVDFIKGKTRDAHLRLWFIGNALAHPMRPQRGITVIGNLSSRNSISKVLRDLVIALQEAHVPLQIYDLDQAEKPNDFRSLRYSHVFEMFGGVFPSLPGIHRHRIAFWEFDTGLFEAYQQLKTARSLIAMSDFNAEIFRKNAPVGVRVDKLLYPFRFLPPTDLPSADEIRNRYGIPAKAFMVFFNFDFGSSFSRKNPDGALRAFAEAFHDTPDAVLVFKTMNAKRFPEKMTFLNKLAEENGIANRFFCINDYLSDRDLYGLTAACDCYLSLHRGEGFGLGVAEAMSLGRPAVVTDYSSTTEFCHAGNSMPVPYKLVDVPPEMHDHPNYRFVKHWAEPDLHAAAVALRKLYDDRDHCVALGRHAQDSLCSHFSPTRFSDSASALLDI